MKFFWITLIFVLSSAGYAGVTTKVPASGSAEATVYDSRTYRISGGEQEDFEGANWACMHRTPFVESVSTIYGTATTTFFLGAYDCSDGETLHDWNADEDGTWIFNEYFKPPGIKWTATTLECMLTYPAPTLSSGTLTADEDIRFAVGWRDGDSVSVDTTNIVTLDSDDVIGVSQSATPNLEIGTTAEVAGMVVMIQTDADGGDTGPDYNDLNTVCMVTLKVE